VREVLRRAPKNPPDDPTFIGTVGNGAFKLTPRVLAPDDLAYSRIRRPPVRGRITASDTGSEIRLLFCDPTLSLMAGGMSLAASVVILARTGGWPLWQAEHGMLALVIGAAMGFSYLSLRTDIRRGTEAIRNSVR